MHCACACGNKLHNQSTPGKDMRTSLTFPERLWHCSTRAPDRPPRGRIAGSRQQIHILPARQAAHRQEGRHAGRRHTARQAGRLCSTAIEPPHHRGGTLTPCCLLVLPGRLWPPPYGQAGRPAGCQAGGQAGKQNTHKKTGHAQKGSTAWIITQSAAFLHHLLPPPLSQALSGRFLVNGREVVLAVARGDSLALKVEALRAFLDEAIGTADFVRWGGCCQLRWKLLFGLHAG